jgi:hypothetical protein
MGGMFDRLSGLSDQQRGTIKERYRFLMSEYRRRLWMYAVLFYCLRITMTVGSLTVPALLSLSVAPSQADMLKWLTWAISLAVTTANGLITLFKVDKRFFMLHSVAERLRTETWQYLSLAGRYSGHYGSYKPTHVNQYVYYTSQMEKIRMKHIEEEFIRQADISDPNKNHPPPTTSAAPPTSQEPNCRAHPPLTAVDVPSPADQAALTSPPSRPHTCRRESESTVESNDDSIVHVPATAAINLPVPGRAKTLSPSDGQGQPLLLQTSELSALSAKPRGAAVQSITV